MFGGKFTADYHVEQKYEIAYFPIASFQQYGPHLPLTSSILVTHALSEQISTELNAFMLPVQPFSTNYEHDGDKYSVGLDAGLVYEMVLDIANELKRQGFNKLVLHQGHGGIFMIFPLVRHINANVGIKTVLVNPFDLFVAEDKGIIETKDNLHGCEVNTSLLLHVNEELVRKDKMIGVDFVPDKPRSFLNYKSIPAICPDGVWGHPSYATKEKGQKLFETFTQLSVAYIREAFDFMDRTGDYTGGREAAYLEELKKS